MHGKYLEKILEEKHKSRKTDASEAKDDKCETSRKRPRLENWTSLQVISSKPSGLFLCTCVYYMIQWKKYIAKFL